MRHQVGSSTARPLTRSLCVALAVVSFLAPTRALAQDTSGQDTAGQNTAGQDAAGQVHDEYSELLAQETRFREEQEAATRRAADLAAQVATLDAQIVEIEAQLAGAEATFVTKQGEADASEAHLAEIERRLDFERQRLRDQSVQAYIGGGATPMPNIARALERAGSLNDLATGRVYASVVTDDRKHLIAGFSQARDEVEVQRAQVEIDRKASEDARDQVAAQAAELDAQRIARVESQRQSEAALAEATRLADEMEQRRRDLEVRYAEMTISSDSISAMLAARQKDQVPPPGTFGILLNPIKNAAVVSTYGMRLHPILNYERMHTGLDIDGGMGDPMRASEAGVVVIAQEQGGYGNAVVIDHGNTLSTLYGHMSRLDVVPGDVVERGQVLGLVGSTGQSTGPHCHWEVRVLGVPVDGTPYLDRTVEP